jgi:hypothetical protein
LWTSSHAGFGDPFGLAFIGTWVCRGPSAAATCDLHGQLEGTLHVGMSPELRTVIGMRFDPEFAGVPFASTEGVGQLDTFHYANSELDQPPVPEPSLAWLTLLGIVSAARRRLRVGRKRIGAAGHGRSSRRRWVRPG